MLETWKNLDEIDNVQISNYGNFCTIPHYYTINRGFGDEIHYCKGGLRKKSIDPKGYEKILFSNYKGKAKAFNVHRLVAKYFLPDYDENLEVDHIDNNRSNNIVTNLRMVTRLENVRKPQTLENIRKALKNVSIEERKIRHEKAIETMKRKGTYFGRNLKPVLQYDKEGNFIKEWESAKSVENELGIKRSSIGRCCNGKRKTAGKFVWRYK